MAFHERGEASFERRERRGDDFFSFDSTISHSLLAERHYGDFPLL